MTESLKQEFTTGQLATLACLLEVSFPKPGNVHRSADFEDTTLQDFMVSAVAIAPAMEAARVRSLGETVLRAIQATRQVVNVNTNLGLVLLMAPLAKVDRLESSAISNLIVQTTVEDCRHIYEAIQMSEAGGLGQTEVHDVHQMKSPDHILEAMRLAEKRDMIARQYTHGFSDVLDFILPELISDRSPSMPLVDRVIQAHLKSMHRFPDSLIARKNGMETAHLSAAMAGDVLSSGKPGDPNWLKAVSDFDFWLRADGNRRNPGTTADLVAAALFAGLRFGKIHWREVSD